MAFCSYEYYIVGVKFDAPKDEKRKLPVFRWIVAAVRWVGVLIPNVFATGDWRPAADSGHKLKLNTLADSKETCETGVH